jgi:hypothetical protein
LSPTSLLRGPTKVTDTASLVVKLQVALVLLPVMNSSHRFPSGMSGWLLLLLLLARWSISFATTLNMPGC